MTTIAPPPPAPAAAPPPLSPGGRTAVRVLVVVAAAALVAGCVLSLGTVAWGLSSFRVIADAKSLPAGMKSLIIDTGEIPAAVRITADRDAREPRVTMRLINSNRAGEHSLVVTDDAGATRLTLVGERSSLPDFGRAGELNVTLPPDLARKLSVTTQQETGVLLAQTDLDQIVVHNTDGDVVLSGGARRIEIHTQDGDVVAREPISVTEAFVAEVVDGNVTVDFKDAAPRTVDVVTRDGDVALSLPSNGPYLVHAQSGDSTRVRVPETSDPGRAIAEVTARSDDGAVTISTLGTRSRHR